MWSWNERDGPLGVISPDPGTISEDFCEVFLVLHKV